MKQSSGTSIRSIRDINRLYTGALVVKRAWDHNFTVFHKTNNVCSYKTLTAYISETRAS